MRRGVVHSEGLLDSGHYKTLGYPHSSLIFIRAEYKITLTRLYSPLKYVSRKLLAERCSVSRK